MKKAALSRTTKLLFLSLLASGIALPNTSSLEAQKTTPSIQQGSRTYLQQENANRTVPNDPDFWKTFEYEDLLAFTPTPSQGGEYIDLLIRRTNQRYDQIRALDIPADEKSCLAKKVYRKTNSKIGKVRSSISRYLRSSSKSF